MFRSWSVAKDFCVMQFQEFIGQPQWKSSVKQREGNLYVNVTNWLRVEDLTQIEVRTFGKDYVESKSKIMQCSRQINIVSHLKPSSISHVFHQIRFYTQNDQK